MHKKVLRIISEYVKQAPVNIEGLGRALGLRVIRNADLPLNISGHLKLGDGDVYEIASSKREHYFRQRFTLAHEIGHFVLHKNLVDEWGGVDDDTKYRSTDRGDIYNSLIELFHEKQANSFAASVLMPEHLVRKYIDDYEGEDQIPLSQLYRHFQVSPSAMKWRLDNLDLLRAVNENA